jgi:hypothetical protein
VSDLGTDSEDPSALVFQGHQEWAKQMSDHLLFHLSPASHYYSTQHAYSVKHSDSCVRLVQMSHKCSFALPRIVLPRFRNINLIPFRDIRVTVPLRID